ncbi:MAG: hypothetical protein NT154_11785 [Verrucomicrobia bacterium]|nr:hypothetical protein [Verrucomicrobiota bacterium]
MPEAVSAAVATISYYRLGENDPGAVASQTAGSKTTDIVNGLNLAVAGTPPTYSANTGVSGSTLCVAVAGGGYTNSAPFAWSDNWGLEARVKAATTAPSLSSDGYATLVFNGDSGANGMGILQTPDGRFKGLCGGVGFVGGISVVTGAWTHVALVTAGGTTTFYVNGVEAGTGVGPRAPAGFFGIGINPGGYGSGEPFQGSLDEVRVFGFAPGQFSTNDLLLTSVPPAPRAPVILSGPTATPAGAIVYGTWFSLGVVVGGTGPFSFQWRTNGAPLAGATNATLTFTNATANNSGAYSVQVSNLYGGVTSSAVSVTVQSLADAVTNAVRYLESKAEEMIQADRYPMSNGVTAFPPQVGSGYDAFWLRDYAYILEGRSTAFTTNELLGACQVFINALREDGAGVDCVRYSGQPIYEPGYGTMGSNPVADGSQFTVEVAWYTYQQTKDRVFLQQIIDSLVKTMQAAPRDPQTGLIYIKPVGWDRCPYGFTDSVRQQGDVLFCSLLYLQACRQLADLLDAVNRPEDAGNWRYEAEKLAPVIHQTFWDGSTGLFRAATVYCGQPDIWGSAFAVWLGVATPQQAATIAGYFADHYSEIVQCGQIRHLPGGVYWDAACARDTYQNGGFWATATGWFVYTLSLVDPVRANQTVVSLVNDFQARGVNEWVFGSTIGVSRYLSSITMPLAGVQKMLAVQSAAPQVVIGPTVSPNPLVLSGASFSLSVAASGNAPLYYQWRHAGAVLSGTNAASVVFTKVTYAGSTVASVSFSNATATASGIYDVVVTNAFGATTSAVVVVTVLPAGSNTLTPVAYYRLGENDPGAVAGQTVGATTIDIVHGVNLAVVGTPPVYATNTGVSGSRLCVDMAGGGFANHTGFALNANWGVEAWVKAASTTPSRSTDGYATIVFNGDSASDGMGIMQTPGGQFIGICGGVALVGGATVVPGAWTHLAIVTTGGTTTFYVNGVPTGTAPGPFPPSGFFGIGINPAGYGGGELFEGSLDEARGFTFAPGGFSTNDLLLASAPPVSSVGILPAGHNVVVLWNGASLQQAGSLSGPWISITNVTSPWVAPVTSHSQFFRAGRP